MIADGLGVLGTPSLVLLQLRWQCRLWVTFVDIFLVVSALGAFLILFGFWYSFFTSTYFLVLSGCRFPPLSLFVAVRVLLCLVPGVFSFASLAFHA